MRNKITIDLIRYKLLDKNCTLLTQVYVRNKSPLEYICNFHTSKGIQLTNWNRLRDGHGCKYCAIERNADKQRLTIDHIKEKMLEKGLILLEDKYIDNHTNMKYKCITHPENIQHITWNNFQSGRNCALCAKNARREKLKKPFEEVEKVFNENYYKLITSNYINNRQELEFICLKHKDKGVQKTTYGELSVNKGKCSYCTKDRIYSEQALSLEQVKSFFDYKGLILLEENYINAHTKMKYICKNSPERIQSGSYANVYKRDGCCLICVNKSKSRENSNLWKGGITPLHNFMRDKIVEWKKESARAYNYKCIITGDGDFIIHHLFSFANILRETMEELQLPFNDKINEYTDKELKAIEELLIRKHFEYGLGIPLSKETHEEFHKIYGKGDNTPSQFEEFLLSKGLNTDILKVGGM